MRLYQRKILCPILLDGLEDDDDRMIDSGMFRMTASDEDPVSRGKNNKKNSGNKGNKKEEKKKPAKESPKEQGGKKAEGKAPKNASASTNPPPTEKKNKGKFVFLVFFLVFRSECNCFTTCCI